RRRASLGTCFLAGERLAPLGSTARPVPRSATAPAARASSLGSFGRLRAPREEPVASTVVTKTEPSAASTAPEAVRRRAEELADELRRPGRPTPAGTRPETPAPTTPR